MDDSFRLANADLIHVSVPFKLIKYIVKEESYAPWYALQSNLGYMDKMLRSGDPETYVLFQVNF